MRLVRVVYVYKKAARGPEYKPVIRRQGQSNADLLCSPAGVPEDRVGQSQIHTGNSIAWLVPDEPTEPGHICHRCFLHPQTVEISQGSIRRRDFRHAGFCDALPEKVGSLSARGDVSGNLFNFVRGYSIGDECSEQICGDVHVPL